MCRLRSIYVNLELKGKISVSVISAINLLERERERGGGKRGRDRGGEGEREGGTECKVRIFLQLKFKIPGLSSKYCIFVNLMVKACCVKC